MPSTVTLADCDGQSMAVVYQKGKSDTLLLRQKRHTLHADLAIFTRCPPRDCWATVLDWGMRFATDSQVIDCPYCGESYELIVDVSESEQRYIEDCYVCCAPIQFTVTVAPNGEVFVLAQHENDC